MSLLSATVKIAVCIVVFGVYCGDQALARQGTKGAGPEPISSAAGAKEQTGSLKGITPKKLILWSDDASPTTSQTYVNVPGMVKTLRVNPGLLTVTFCSQAYADNNAVYVQVLLGNKAMLPGTEIQYESSSGYRSNAKCFTWFENIKKAKNQKIKVQYRSVTGDTIYLETRSLTIEYN